MTARRAPCRGGILRGPAPLLCPPPPQRRTRDIARERSRRENPPVSGHDASLAGRLLGLLVRERRPLKWPDSPEPLHSAARQPRRNPRPPSARPATTAATSKRATHPIRRGAMPTDRVYRHRQQAQTRKRAVNAGTTRPPQARRSSTRSGLNATPQNPGLHNVSVTWARQVVALTLSCAAGPDTWSMGTPAHTPPIGLTCASKGPGIHPSGRTCHPTAGRARVPQHVLQPHIGTVVRRAHPARRWHVSDAHAAASTNESRPRPLRTRPGCRHVPRAHST